MLNRLIDDARRAMRRPDVPTAADMMFNPLPLASPQLRSYISKVFQRSNG
ncbi:MAG: hypothetical protein NZT92_20590 [Abditibacteriales bacterium]|nr:hypothetical protein [Abditibacteriales bacterium]MDW8368116.1 hypothetical protein [Abditibacteriales bacterium]